MQAFLFDLFGVIARTQSPAGRQRLLHAFGPCDPERFWDAYWRFRPSYDAGLYGAEGYWALVGGALGSELSGDRVRALAVADLESWSGIDQAAVGLVCGLSGAGHRVGLLSNIPPELADAYREHPWLGLFASVGFSCDIGYPKPDPRAFAWSLQDLGAEPAEVTFIDDSPANVDAARSLGLTALLFTSLPDLQARLAPAATA
jgi:putative hydrolase of the HAD superfamily